MGVSYVVDGATLSCNHGSSKPKLKILPDRTVKLKGKGKANVGDSKPMVNIQPFGMCKSPTNPAVIAVKAASQGATTEAPCTPACAMWLNGKNDVLVQKLPALLSNSTLICMIGAGTIKIEDDGQE